MSKWEKTAVTIAVCMVAIAGILSWIGIQVVFADG